MTDIKENNLGQNKNNKIYKGDKVIFYARKRYAPPPIRFVDGEEYIAKSDSYIDKISGENVVFLKGLSGRVLVSHCKIIKRHTS